MRVGATEEQVCHGSAFQSDKVPKNGLRPRWSEEDTFVGLASHPELAILYIEVRCRRGSHKDFVCYEALPLTGLQTGFRTPGPRRGQRPIRGGPHEETRPRFARVCSRCRPGNQRREIGSRSRRTERGLSPSESRRPSGTR